MSPDEDTYTCAACGKTYAKVRDEAEAMIESKTLWGDIAPSDLCVICDDCFERWKDAALLKHHANIKPN